MAAPAHFYLKQAELCEQAAATTPLDNRRETLLRSRAAWLELANRELEVQAGRAKREKERLNQTQEETSHAR